MPRRKSSFSASRATRRAFCSSTRARSSASRRATATLAAKSSRRSWSAGSQRIVAGAWPTRTPAISRPLSRSALTGRGSPGTRSSISIASGSPRTIRASIRPRASRASVAARSSRTAAPSAGAQAVIASTARATWRLRRARSAASSSWRSASRPSSSSGSCRSGSTRSPAVIRSSRASSARRGPTMLPTSRPPTARPTRAATTRAIRTRVAAPGAPAGDEQEAEGADRQERGDHHRDRDPDAEPAAAHVGSTSRR